MIGSRKIKSYSRMHSLAGSDSAFVIGKAELVVEINIRL